MKLVLRFAFWAAVLVAHWRLLGSALASSLTAEELSRRRAWAERAAFVGRIELLAIVAVAVALAVRSARRAGASPRKAGAALLGGAAAFGATFLLGTFVLTYASVGAMQIVTGRLDEGTGFALFFASACAAWVAAVAAAPIGAAAAYAGRARDARAVWHAQLWAAAGSLVANAVALRIPPVSPGVQLTVLEPVAVVILLSGAGYLRAHPAVGACAAPREGPQR